MVELGAACLIAAPFACAYAAIAALIGASRDDRRLVESSRRAIYAFCGARGIPYYESAANFVLVRIGDRATTITQALASRGIFIRDRSTQPGCDGCVRITAGLVDHTTRCLDALEGLL